MELQARRNDGWNTVAFPNTLAEAETAVRAFRSGGTVNNVAMQLMADENGVRTRVHLWAKRQRVTQY